MNAASSDDDPHRLPLVGNPLLGQIQEFIESDNTEQPALDPLGIVTRALRGRERVSAVAILIAGLLAAIAAWLIVQPVFQSLGMIRVLPREAKILYADSDDSRLRLYDAFVTAEMQFIQSRPVLDHALYFLNQDPTDLTKVPRDVGDVAGMLNVTNKKGLVSIAARNGNPVVAASVVNAVLDAYQAHNDEARRRQYEVRERELSERESELEQALTILNEDYLKIGGEHDVGTLAKAHTAKTTQLEVIEERIAELEDTITQLQSTGGAGADVGDVEIQRATLLDNALADMIYERARRMAELETLKQRFQSTHPDLLSATAELVILEGAIAERRDQIATLGKSGALTVGGAAGKSESIADLGTVRDRLADRREAVREEATEYNSKLVNIRMVAAEQKRVTQLLVETKRALDEVKVENHNDLSGSIEVVARGGVAERPIENKGKPAAFGAAVFGGLGTLAGIILLTLLGGRIRFSDDLEPRTRKLLAAVAPERDGPAGLEFAAHKVRNELDLGSSSRESPSLVVGVVGTAQGSGCSSFAVSLAKAFAAAGRKVLLVDADVSNGELSQRFGCAGSGGLRNVALRELDVPDVLRQVDVGSCVLDMLPVGTDTRFLPELYSSELSLNDLRQVVTTLKEAHQIVIADLGMLKAGQQSAMGISITDRVVLVTAALEQKRRLNGALEILERLAPKRFMLILNRVSSLDPQIHDSTKSSAT